MDSSTNTDAKSSSSIAPQKQSKPLACTACRARKLGCNRIHPCYNCVRSGAECIFPVRRRPQKPRKAKNAELLQRLNRLETIVSKVGVEGLDQEDAQGPHLAKPRVQSFFEEYQSPRKVDDDQAGELRPEDRASARYLSGQFWSNLCGEVEGLRQALEHSTDSDEEDGPSEGTTPESTRDHTSPSVSSGLLPGYPLRAGHGFVPQHPEPDHVRYLADIYFQNFDIIVKILHRPTVLATLRRFADASGDRTQLGPEQEALFFAIYYAAVTTLPAGECAAHLGRERGELVRAFQAGLEHSLARADYLNSDSLETLQALTIYVACLRCHSGSRSSWALLSLPIRLAQALGLHREAGGAGDGATAPRFSAYETELRRRLWWQLIVLDIRGVEDRGSDPIVARDSYNTRLPLNLDDDDFCPDTPGPLAGREGPTDMTFSLCTAQSSGIFLYLNYMASGTGPHSRPPSEEETVAHAQHLEAQFVAGVGPDTSHVGAYIASFTVRLIILKLWLVTQYPTHRRRDRAAAGRYRAEKQQRQQRQDATVSAAVAGAAAGSGPGPGDNNITGYYYGGNNNNNNNNGGGVSREATLRTAVSIMELSHHTSSAEPIAPRFGWWSATYVQWHPLAVALAELCSGGIGRELADRAWRVVDEVFPLWAERIADTKRGTLWRPIRKLHRKAKAARRAALGSEDGVPSVCDKTTMPNPAPGVMRNYTADTSLPMAVEPLAGSATQLAMPPDLDSLAISLSTDLSGNAMTWPGISFDMPTGERSWETMDWSTWDEFLNDTFAEGPQTSSSDGTY
ncbi:hypothetical protein DL764_008875 [Monosporascus ibericus]|uniref:Zn(2)-C6 fungal-type domain-containing protein n=1 Tax=Monosporascus ibericus TaxID=155417 RepID=A0A4Q4SWG4_9PEZI|nr:hypothetical protein DL764_008875 [Monosporascus ibericus]